MRRLWILVVLALVGFVLVVPAAQAEPTPSPFAGAWIGSDPPYPDGDGSTVHLDITRGPSARIAFTDEFGTVCENEGASETFFSSILTGRVQGDRLIATFKIARCGGTIIRFLQGETVVYEYDDNGTPDLSNDDTLFDGSVLWERDN